jgi:hypothetical protein
MFLNSNGHQQQNICYMNANVALTRGLLDSTGAEQTVIKGWSNQNCAYPPMVTKGAQ